MRGVGPISEKETRILNLLAEHRTYEDIGDHMGIRLTTVYHHIASIMLKTDIHKKELLIKYAIDHGYGSRKRVPA